MESYLGGKLIKKISSIDHRDKEKVKIFDWQIESDKQNKENQLPLYPLFFMFPGIIWLNSFTRSIMIFIKIKKDKANSFSIKYTKIRKNLVQIILKNNFFPYNFSDKVW